jgi:hypothetical protein
MIKSFSSQNLLLKNAVFWDVVPCRYFVNRHFGGTYHLHLQDRKVRVGGTSVSRWLPKSKALTWRSWESSKKLRNFAHPPVNICLIVWLNFNFLILVYSFIKISAGAGKKSNNIPKEVLAFLLVQKNNTVNKIQNGSNLCFLPNNFNLTQAFPNINERIHYPSTCLLTAQITNKNSSCLQRSCQFHISFLILSFLYISSRCPLKYSENIFIHDLSYNKNHPFLLHSIKHNKTQN